MVIRGRNIYREAAPPLAQSGTYTASAGTKQLMMMLPR
jgi:hypothetical protein